MAEPVKDADRAHDAQPDFALARAGAYDALAPIRSPRLRAMLADDVAVTVIGRGDWGADRYRRIIEDEAARLRIVRAVLRDLPDTVIVSSGPVEAAVTSAAEAARR